jgi:hypothetical protein
MIRLKSNLLLLMLGLLFGFTQAQFDGGVGGGDTRTLLLSALACEGYYGGAADGAAFGLRANPIPCAAFSGGAQDGFASDTIQNPQPCISFTGGVQDGAAVDTLLSPTPCVAYFGTQRDGADFGYLSCTPLAVLGTPLYGELVGNDGRLWWTTFSEVNNLGFSIQRSVDRLYWQEIGFLQTSLNQHTAQAYETWDRAMQPGVNYYRWEQIDLGGARARSNVVALLSSGSDGLLLYPNPVLHTEPLHVQPGGSATLLRWELIDGLGKVLRRWETTSRPSDGRYDIMTEGLGAGIYVLVLRDGKRQQAAKFVVQ